ncbi:T9SS type A sorting domain-containing protein [candidate division KSB1 bacterium]|nr:T9SS type A sorting domain-containing protein [candidate division KSB1 bacterium]
MKKAVIFTLLIFSVVSAQENKTSIRTVDNYLEWGWQAIVMENDLITVATMPAIGARIMQYDLGEHHSIFANEDELGKTYTPASNSGWPNIGGFKNWPAPQDRWGWPPPPVIDFGLYEANITADTPDSVSLHVKSQLEKWITPNLRFERATTIYRGTSRVRVAQTIYNDGSEKADWSVWDITQAIVNHPGERDFENFWVYFTINPDSRYGEDGVRWSATSKAWVGEVAPGIFGVQFKPEGKKIFADSHEGWVSYVDERDGYTYVKVFQLFEGQSYPDEEAHVEVWISSNPLYLEVEVVSPMMDLAPNGGSYTFVEDWYAAKLHGPTLHANHAGAIAGKLTFQPETSTLHATYGVFYTGSVSAAFVDKDENILGWGTPHPVTPQETLVLNEVIDIPEGTEKIDVYLIDSDGLSVGILESAKLSEMTTVQKMKKTAPHKFRLMQNYPNPFNPSTTIEFELDRSEDVTLAVYDVQGRKVETLLSQYMSGGYHKATWNATGLSGGVYFCRLEGKSVFDIKKLLLLK